MDERFHEAAVRTDARADEARRQAHRRAYEVDRELRGHLADVLAGGITARVAGVLLLLFGILLSVAGNIVGLYA